MVWTVVSNWNHAKAVAALIELGFSQMVAAIVSLAVLAEAVVCLLVLATCIILGVVVGVACAFVWLDDRGYLGWLGAVISAVDRALRAMANAMPKREKKVSTEEEVSINEGDDTLWEDRWPRTVKFLDAVGDLVELFVDWVAAKKEKVCKIREVEPMPQ